MDNTYINSATDKLSEAEALLQSLYRALAAKDNCKKELTLLNSVEEKLLSALADLKKENPS